MKKNKLPMRKGMGTVDVILGIVLGMVVFMAGVYIYTSSHSSVSSDAESSKFTTVILAVERAKQDHSDTYPAMSATALNNAGLVTSHLGGATAAAKYSSWTYACASNQLTIVAPAFNDTNIADLVAAKINSSNPAWSAVSNSGVVTVTRTNVTCN